jgi:hypothetical protein
MMLKGLNSEGTEVHEVLLPTFHAKFLNYQTSSVTHIAENYAF